MTDRGVILYGPPTSGKDTITAELSHQDERFILVTKLKAGVGRTTGYRAVSVSELEKLRDADRLVAETRRYGNVYAVDRDDIEALTAADRYPVVHMGNVADMQRLRVAFPLEWTCVLLWVSREVCEQRSRERGDTDTPERLQAWDETYAYLRSAQDALFDLTFHTDRAEPARVAREIIDAITGGFHRVGPRNSRYQS